MAKLYPDYRTEYLLCVNYVLQDSIYCNCFLRCFCTQFYDIKYSYLIQIIFQTVLRYQVFQCNTNNLHTVLWYQVFLSNINNFPDSSMISSIPM